ncbi:MAG: SDR family oxidoreductase [Woeseiaceae bacterium]
MELQLEGRVVMVAAASEGIGYGIAEALAREGARLSIASRSAGKIGTAAQTLRDKYGVECNGYVMDAADAASIQSWTGATLRDFAAVDGLVINAGGPPPGNFDAFDDAAWAGAFELTLMSAVRMVRSVLPQMRRQGSGSILTVTSSSIKEPLDNLLLSNVLRSGVVALVKSLANELAGEGIRVNNLVPGRIDTARVHAIDTLSADKKGIALEEERQAQFADIPLGRYGTIEDMGAAGAFLLSGAAQYITGATLVVDGGKTRTIF